MTKYIFSTILLLNFFSLHSVAQSNTFKLADYTLPDLQFQALNLFASFNTGNGVSKSFDSSSSEIRRSTNLSGSSFLAFSLFENNTVWQKSHSGRASLSGRFTDFQFSDNSYLRYTQFSYSGDYELMNRQYNSTKGFSELGFYMMSDFWKSYEKEENIATSMKTTTHQGSIFLLPSMKIGIGRIDQITDSRWAIFILQRLEKKGRLSRAYTEEDVRSFAEMLSTIYFKRYFDFRLRRISELEAIDQFLQTQGLIQQTDITYFSQLNDMVGFGRGPLRFSGKRFSFAIYGGYHFLSFNEAIFSEKFHNHAGIVNMGPEFRKEHAINLNLQNTIDFYLHAGFILGKEINKTYEQNSSYLNPKLSIGISDKLGYYPNTRSRIEVTGNINSTLTPGEGNLFSGQTGIDAFGANMSTDIDYVYFINPRFQVNFQLNTNFNLLKDNGSSLFNVRQATNESLLFLLNYPNCSDNFCFRYSNQGKRFTTSFSIQLSYSIF